MTVNFFLDGSKQNGFLHGRTPDDVQRKCGNTGLQWTAPSGDDFMRCPLCNQGSAVEVEFKSLVSQGICDRCGYIRITEDAVTEADRVGKRHVISAWFRRIDSHEVPLVKNWTLRR
jgi:hypothetical protein